MARYGLYFLVPIFLILSYLWIESKFDSNKISYVGFKKIEKGMTIRQIYTLLGNPSDNNDLLLPLMNTSAPRQLESDLPAFPELISSSWTNWLGDKGELVVFFNSQGVVNGKAFIPK